MMKFAEGIDRINRAMGRAVAWCALAMMFFQIIAVLMRYVFSYGLITFQEAVVYCHAALFLLGGAYVLLRNEHVRVDIFYNMVKARTRRFIDIIALTLFVLPVAGIILWYGLPYVIRSWATLEGSRQAGGLPAIFLLKSTIVVFASSVGLQAVAIAIRLFGKREDPYWLSQLPENQNGSD